MGGGAVAIRVATIADADAIHAGLVAMGHHAGVPQKVRSTPEDIARYGFGPNARFNGLIAEVDGLFAGMCLYFASFSTWIGKPGIYVQDIFVDESFRGQHIGERLIAAVAKRCADGGGVYLRLSVDIDNVTAQSFYSSLGMGWSKTERVYAAYHEAFQALAERSQETIA